MYAKALKSHIFIAYESKLTRISFHFHWILHFVGLVVPELCPFRETLRMIRNTSSRFCPVNYFTGRTVLLVHTRSDVIPSNVKNNITRMSVTYVIVSKYNATNA